MEQSHKFKSETTLRKTLALIAYTGDITNGNQEPEIAVRVVKKTSPNGSCSKNVIIKISFMVTSTIQINGVKNLLKT
jgi:hypothetical protein